jgi:hypothetical protein
VPEALNALVIEGKGQDDGGGAGAKTPTTAESVAVSVPLVQFKVSVVEAVSVGYHGWLEGMGPPEPEREMPESPVGEVRVQAVAPPEVQL